MAERFFEQEGLSQHLVVHFYKEGHAVLQEDAELLVHYFNKMHYGLDEKWILKY